MKLVAILPTLNAGGVERVTITYLRQLDPSRFCVDLIVFQPSDALRSFVPDWVRVHVLGSGGAKTSILPLLAMLRRLAPQIVYTGHARVAAILALVRPFLPPFKHLARLQSTPSLERKYGAYGSLRRWAYSFGYRWPDRVVAETDDMQESAIQSFGISPAKLVTLENPIDFDFIRSKSQALPTPFDPSRVNILAAGRLGFEKGFDILLKSLPDVLKAIPNARLHIIGRDVGEQDGLEQLVGVLGISDQVRFWGDQSNPYVFFANCDVFVLSSRWEGAPNVLIENYCLNTPLVTTRFAPNVDRWVQDGQNGYVAEVEDVASLGEAIVKASQLSRAQIHNPAYCGSRLDALISDVLGV